VGSLDRGVGAERHRHHDAGRHGHHDAGRISGDLLGPPSPGPRSRADAAPDRVRTVVRTFGEVLITLGIVVLLFVVYEVYVTDLISAGKQRDATAALDDRWRGDDAERVEHFDGLKEGEGFAKMYIPVFGGDYNFTILEGTTEKTLEIGPGHYAGTAYPGEAGNFAVAGHRVGKGAPFNDLDLLNSCDAIIVETQHNWFVYRVMPKADEKAGWATTPRCEGVLLGDAYSDVVGQEIVSPKNGSVIAPIPNKPDATDSAGEQASLLTLTTCHPKFSDRQRLIVHAVLVHQIPKDQLPPGQPPDEMKETS
jgi:sortase A